jgi:hypothetical protein
MKTIRIREKERDRDRDRHNLPTLLSSRSRACLRKAVSIPSSAPLKNYMNKLGRRVINKIRRSVSLPATSKTTGCTLKTSNQTETPYCLLLVFRVSVPQNKLITISDARNSLRGHARKSGAYQSCRFANGGSRGSGLLVLLGFLLASFFLSKKQQRINPIHIF